MSREEEDLEEIAKRNREYIESFKEEITIKDKRSFLKRNHPFGVEPKFNDEMFCGGCSKLFKISEYRVLKNSEGHKLMVCPTKGCDTPMHDWIDKEMYDELRQAAIEELEQEKKAAPQLALGNAPLYEEEAKWMKSFLPADYTCTPLKDGVKCWSKDNEGKGDKFGISDDDDEHWGFILAAIRQRFGDRFREVYHVVWHNHQHFNVYLTEEK